MMIKLEGSQKALRWLLSTAVVALLVAGGAPLLQPAAVLGQDGEQGKDWKNITMIYTTDIKGKIEPCG